MARAGFQPANLSAGQFYGDVPVKRSVASSILSEVIHPVAVDVPEHSHELAYFTLVLNGEYFEKFGSRSSVLKPMSILWHRAGISHRDKIGTNGARCFTVEIQHSGMKSLSLCSSIPDDFAERSSQLVWTGTRLFHEFKTWQSSSELVAEGLTLEMLGQAARVHTQLEKHEPKWLSHVIEKLNDDFESNVSTGELASVAGVHPVHLSAVFRKFYGQTIGEYVQQLRVSKASSLLIGSEMPLIDIAYTSGFADQSHMTRTFKRHTGLTPGAFRKTVA